MVNFNSLRSLTSKVHRMPAMKNLTQSVARTGRVTGVTTARRFMGAVTHPMTCFQCEQTRDNVGCMTDRGVCGKTAEVAGEQDLIIQLLKEACWYAKEIQKKTGTSVQDDAFNERLLDSMFSTLTNVNFDPARMAQYIRAAANDRDTLKAKYLKVSGGKGAPFVDTNIPFSASNAALAELGLSVGVEARRAALGNNDVFGLNEMLTYGLKGLCAYAEHAVRLGHSDAKTYEFIAEALAFQLEPESAKLDAVLGMLMKCGEVNLHVMEMLDQGHFEKLGKATPTEVDSGHVAGKCILISGHDMVDLKHLLEQTEGKGINVYTHGEMLPAHGYPELKKFKHLKGHFGGPWQLQKLEFSQFPGPIVMTSNCLVEPQRRYADRIFTRGSVGWPGVPHLNSYDFSSVIKKAQETPGFSDDKPGQKLSVGWNHRSVLDAAPLILDAIKEGKLKRFLLLGGCDGSEGERNVMTEMAKNAPRDSAILTVGCAKYRFNRNETGNVDGTGIPRLIDMGQCNDAYGAVKVALTLSEVLKVPVNDLPIFYGISWFEQKAVAVLLTLLHLGVNKIHLGPYLPAFVTPPVLGVLQENFKLAPLSAAPKDFGLSK